MVGYFTEIFLYLVNNIFQKEIFSSLEKTHFDPDLPWKEKPMKVNSVIDVHVSIFKKIVNHLSFKAPLICSLQQIDTINETIIMLHRLLVVFYHEGGKQPVWHFVTPLLVSPRLVSAQSDV